MGSRSCVRQPAPALTPAANVLVADRTTSLPADIQQRLEIQRLNGVSSDIRFWSSGDTKTGPPDGLLMGA